MKYKDFYSQLLTEGRKEDVLNKLKKIGRESDLDKLMSLDKTPTKKHAVKLADYYVEVKDLGIIESYYNRFIENGNLNTKDINQWKTFKDFENIVDSSNVKVSKAFGEIEEKPIYEDDKIRVFHGDSKEKCIKLSNGYTFCIGRNDGGNLYNHYRYNAETTFYFIRFKEKSNRLDQSSKKYEDEDHYIVIQALTDGEYFLTVANNYGDGSITKEEIIKKYPETEILFSKNIIKPLHYTDKEQYVMSNIQGKLFKDMKTIDDQVLWAEMNPYKQITDEDFRAEDLSDTFRKKYLETRADDISYRDLKWLELNKPSLYKRYVEIKNNQLLAKIKASVNPSYLEINLATDDNFITYIKNHEKMEDLPLYSFIQEAIENRGIRGGKTAIQFLQNVNLFKNEVEALLTTAVEPLDTKVSDFLRGIKDTILTTNVYSILLSIFETHDVYYSTIEFKKDLEDYGELIDELSKRKGGLLWDFCGEVSGKMVGYERDDDSYQKRFAFMAAILDKVEKISNEDLHWFLSLTSEMFIYFVDYCLERFGKGIKNENDGKMLKGILIRARQFEESGKIGYFEKVKWKIYNQLGPEYTNDVTNSLPPTRRLNENTSSGLESLRLSLLSKGVDNLLSEKDGTIYISKISISKPNRGKGLGSSAMEDITKYADETNQIIVLSPDTSFGGTSVDRLGKFYKRFGFKDNRGGKKNFKYRETMIRYPNRQSLGESSGLPDRINTLEKWMKEKRKNIGLEKNIEYEDDEIWDECHEHLLKHDNKYRKIFLAFNALERERSKQRGSWHEDDERYFIRFGDFPKKGKSLNHFTGRREVGVSAYEADWDIKNGKWKISEDNLSGSGRSSIAELDAMQRHVESRRPVYLIFGKMLWDCGSDGEPLFNPESVKILKKLEPDEYYSDTSGINWYNEIDESINESIEVKYVEDGGLGDDDEDLIPDFNDQIEELEKTSNISILRGKELNTVLIENGKVLGALYTELSNSSEGEEFSFDVIVHPDYRNRGLGDKLVKLGLGDYRALKNSYDSKLKLRIDVVNPQLFTTFKKNGLRVIKNISTGRKIMGMD
jgi:ribosomal protein S18 acetylase RimI-like enzyme